MDERLSISRYCKNTGVGGTFLINSVGVFLHHLGFPRLHAFLKRFFRNDINITFIICGRS